MRRLLALALLALGACASPSSEEDDAPATEDIVGGADAFSPSLDAVGGLVITDANDNFREGCSGTLIAKDLVLTAKHCAVTVDAPHTKYLSTGKVYFRMGPNLFDTERVYDVTEVYTCGLDEGGSLLLGCDVAVYRLATPVTDVAPMAFAKTTIPTSAVGHKATIYGYGNQSTTKQVLGTRKTATMTIRTLSGQERTTVFPTFAAYQSAEQKLEGSDFVKKNDAILHAIYDHRLLDGYEVGVGGRSGDGQDCQGDSGGPLVIQENGKPVIYAVDSTGDISGVRNLCHSVGSIYAMLGPEAQRMLSTLIP